MSAQLDRRQLEPALNSWRQSVLTWLGDELREAGEDRVAATDGLAISHRNPGAVSQQTSELLWAELEISSVRAARLEKVIADIEAMDLAALLVLFSRSTKMETYAWEGLAWHLPPSTC